MVGKVLVKTLHIGQAKSGGDGGGTKREAVIQIRPQCFFSILNWRECYCFDLESI